MSVKDLQKQASSTVMHASHKNPPVSAAAMAPQVPSPKMVGVSKGPGNVPKMAASTTYNAKGDSPMAMSRKVKFS